MRTASHQPTSGKPEWREPLPKGHMNAIARSAKQRMKLQQEVRKRLSVGAIIRQAFGEGEELTNAVICERTGQSLKTVSAWVAHLRKTGFLDRVPGSTIPVVHRRTGATIARVNKAALLNGENIVRQARKTQPKCVWDLAKG